MRPALLLPMLLLATGCATTLSTMDTARTVRPGHVQFHGAYGLNLPVGSMVKGAVAAGEAVSDSIKCGKTAISPEQAEQLYEAGVATALSPPSAQWELAFRTGIVNNLDAGVRYSVNSVSADVKFRFLHLGEDDTGKSHHMSIGFRVSKYLFNSPVFEALDYLKLSDFSRWDFEIPLLYSWEYRRYFVFYTGVKYIYSKFSMDQNLYEIQKHVSNMADVGPITDRVDSSMQLYGATLGLGGGYKYVWIYTEINLGYTHLRPNLYSFVDNKVKPRNLDGFVVYPAIGLLFKI